MSFKLEPLLYAIILMTVDSQTVSAADDCPVLCVCSFNSDKTSLDLQCQDETNLDSFFSNHADLREITYHHSRLQSIPPELCLLRRLTSLALPWNSIGQITPRRLACFESLLALDLSNNKLIYINQSAFVGLTRLQEVHLINNTVSDLDSKTFLIPTLTTVELQYNQLSYMDTWPFKISYDHLVYVNLSFNHIERLTNSFNFTFDQLPHSKLASIVIDLRSNQLKHIHDLNFETFNITLASYHLTWNCGFLLRYNPWKCDCDMYKFISNELVKIIIKLFVIFDDKDLIDIKCADPPEATGTVIYDLRPEIFRCHVTTDCPQNCICTSHPGIRRMDVNCGASYTGADMPAVLPKAADIRLNLTQTRVNNLSGQPYLVNVTYFDLSCSQLNAIDSSSIQLLDNATEILLHQNHIAKLPKSVMKLKLQKLTRMTLSGNPIVCDCTSVWLSSWLRNNSVRVADVGRIFCVETYLQDCPLVNVPEHRFFCDDDPLILWTYPAFQTFLLFMVVMLLTCQSCLCCRGVKQCILEKILIRLTAPYQPGLIYDVTIVHCEANIDLAENVETTIKEVFPSFEVHLAFRDVPLGHVTLMETWDMIFHSINVIFIATQDVFGNREFCVHLLQAYNRYVSRGRPRILMAVKLGDRPRKLDP